MAENRSNSNLEDSYGGDQIQVLEGLEAAKSAPVSRHRVHWPLRPAPPRVRGRRINPWMRCTRGYCDTIPITMLKNGGVRVIDNGRGTLVDPQ
jgi:DNA gyrase subunit B